MTWCLPVSCDGAWTVCIVATCSSGGGALVATEALRQKIARALLRTPAPQPGTAAVMRCGMEMPTSAPLPRPDMAPRHADDAASGPGASPRSMAPAEWSCLSTDKFSERPSPAEWVFDTTTPLAAIGRSSAA